MDGAIERIGHVRFRQGPAPARIRGVVSSVWRAVAASDTTLRVIPDGCAELVRSSTGAVQVFGPATRWRDIRLPAEAVHDGVRLRVGAAAAILRIDQQALVDQVIDARDFALPADIVRSAGRQDWLDSLWYLIAERTEDDGIEVITAASKLLAQPHARVGGVANELRIGERRLRRWFERATGLSPTTYRRLVRLNVALTELETSRRPIADLAYRCGYADQAHLCREVRELTGDTPRAVRLISAQPGDVIP